METNDALKAPPLKNVLCLLSLHLDVCMQVCTFIDVSNAGGGVYVILYIFNKVLDMSLYENHIRHKLLFKEEYFMS